MELEIFLRWLHVMGACILLGTGAGIAFFMLMAHRTSNPAFVAHTASIVVVADFLFTATAVIAQPITGIALAWTVGWDLGEGWIVLSIFLYLVTGAFWLPVVRIQMQMRDLAQQAVAEGGELPMRYNGLFRIWFLCGIPAFVAVISIVWLMLAKPSLDLI